ncbi:hypothetical protein MMC07_008584 [Pseudocyphellaria aurata]|nr:hypothetical protein [Pseudocyphellaria aurata]
MDTMANNGIQGSPAPGTPASMPGGNAPPGGGKAPALQCTAQAPTNIPDRTYEKAILKGEIKVTKLNADNYIAWAHRAWDALRQVHSTYSQGQLYFLKTKFFLYKAGASESIEDIKSELCRIWEMIRNKRVIEVPTKFDVAWALVNAVDNKAYNLVKYHLEEMKDLTLAYTVERIKAVEMKLKDTNTLVTKTAHKN